MPLLHINLKPVLTSRGYRFPPYSLAVSIQLNLQRFFLEYKASLSTPNPQPPPLPTLLTFTPAPTYTLGRRQISPLSPSELARLQAPLHVYHHGELETLSPDVMNAPRGGLATYHGPGQLVFWPTMDLHSPLHKRFTVRDYACLLERTTIGAIESATRNDGRDGVKGFTTENPGVWARHHLTGGKSWNNDQDEAHNKWEERKIAAMGVHLRRHVTGLGVAVNINMPITGPEESNPWARITACGLEDKQVTNVASQDLSRDWSESSQHDRMNSLWAEEFAKRIGVEGGVVAWTFDEKHQSLATHENDRLLQVGDAWPDLEDIDVGDFIGGLDDVSGL